MRINPNEYDEYLGTYVLTRAYSYRVRVRKNRIFPDFSGSVTKMMRCLNPSSFSGNGVAYS